MVISSFLIAYFRGPLMGVGNFRNFPDFPDKSIFLQSLANFKQKIVDPTIECHLKSSQFRKAWRVRSSAGGQRVCEPTTVQRLRSLELRVTDRK
jgi:hypothetical protein